MRNLIKLVLAFLLTLPLGGVGEGLCFALPLGGDGGGLVPEVAMATSDEDPVQMAAALYHLQGDTVEVVLHAKIHQGYHIYANVSDQDPFIKTEITMTPPAGYKKVGIMRRPARRPLVAGSKTTTHEGDCIWRQRYVGKSDSADATFNVTVEYQCCDNNICFPPKTLTYNLK